MKTNKYPYNIIRNGEKIKGGTQEGFSMENALETLKTRFKIETKSNGFFMKNYLDGKPVSIAMFGAVELT